MQRSTALRYHFAWGAGWSSPVNFPWAIKTNLFVLVHCKLWNLRRGICSFTMPSFGLNRNPLSIDKSAWNTKQLCTFLVYVIIKQYRLITVVEVMVQFWWELLKDAIAICGTKILQKPNDYSLVKIKNKFSFSFLPDFDIYYFVFLRALKTCSFLRTCVRT